MDGMPLCEGPRDRCVVSSMHGKERKTCPPRGKARGAGLSVELKMTAAFLSSGSWKVLYSERESLHLNYVIGNTDAGTKISFPDVLR